jgi:hypothetical protein
VCSLAVNRPDLEDAAIQAAHNVRPAWCADSSNVVKRGKTPQCCWPTSPGNYWTRSDVTELSGLRDRPLDKPWRFQQKSSASSTSFARLLPAALAGAWAKIS